MATAAMEREQVLTERQRQVLFLCASGMRAKEIAGALHFSAWNIRNDLDLIRVCFGVPTLPAAVVEGFRKGLLAFSEQGELIMIA